MPGDISIIPDPRRILLIQTAFLGDLVLTLPLLNEAHRLWPEAGITVLAESGASGLLEGHAAVESVITCSKRDPGSRRGGMLRLISTLGRQEFDLSLIPHRSFRSALLAFLAKVPRRIGFRSTPGSLLYTDKVTRDPEKHESARNLALLHPFGVHSESHRPHLDTPRAARENVIRWMSEHQVTDNTLITLAPGSVWATKRWPVEHWLRLTYDLSSAGYGVVIVGGPNDSHLGAGLAGETGSRVQNAAGEMRILESAELIRRAALLVSGDTAPVHLAVSVGTPVLALFGPTVPDFGFAPIGPYDRVIGLDLSCRPCAVHGSRKCPLEHHRCMVDLSPEKVLEAALGIIKDSASAKA